jgi:dUTPase
MKIKIINGSKHQLRTYSKQVSAFTILNSPETIDADYWGEVCINLVNLSNENFVIQEGERICQMIIAKHEKDEWEGIDIHPGSEREGVGLDTCKK